MKKAGVAVTFLMGILAAAFAVLGGEPSKDVLDQDLARVRASITDARQEASEYSGGLILALISMREQYLKTTEAMLEQKRSSLLRRINLSYVVDGEKVEPATETQLAAIQADIDRVSRDIENAESEASLYLGGLIQVMHLSTAATGKTTLAMLQQKYFAAKYGMAPLSLAALESAENPNTVSIPGTVVSDEEALR